MNKRIKVITTIVSLLGIISTNSMAEGSKEGDIVRGAQLWADTCMRCHNVRPPEDLSSRAWSFSMNHMRVRAGLTGQETRDILAFILSSKTAEDASK